MVRIPSSSMCGWRLTEVRRLVAGICLAAGLSLPAAALADVALPAVFGNDMVLQRDMKVPVWGTAAPGEEIEVRIGEESVKTKAAADGRWKTTVGPLKAGGLLELTVKGKNSVTFRNVLVGEVWVCSGQSNMQWPVAASANSQEEVAAANHPQIRLLTVPRKVAGEPQSDFVGSWQACSPQTVGSFSAVGYYFGRELQKTLGVPIGLINTSVGGTPAEAWTSRPALESNRELAVLAQRWDKLVADANNPAQQERYQAELARWKEAAKKAKAEGKPAPQQPRPQGAESTSRASGLYNAMVAPLVPFAIRGAIWYQGESNASRAHQYRTLFPAMITDWRQNWGQGEFPFLFVQLANFMKPVPEPADSDWAELREAQSMTLRLPNTGMAVIIDIGEANDIHPKNKQDVGRRLSLAARKVGYGENVVHSGPEYQSMKVEGSRVRLAFRHTGGGLVAKGGGELQGFAIAGPDRKFVWAKAQIEGNDVVVWSDPVAQPTAVRYAWANNPACNLVNTEGLPASPFRTDDFPGLTIDRR